LEELGWPVERAPVAEDWDGLLPWFVAAWDRHEGLRQDVAIRRWYQASRVGMDRVARDSF
jgi:hypothetical protein